MLRSLPHPKTTYRWEGWIFNLVCGLYFFTFSSEVRDAARESIHGESLAHPWLAILLVAMSLLEIYALPEKMKFVRHAIREENDDAGAGFLMWMFHAVISVMVLFVIIESFGFDMVGSGEKDRPEMPLWMGLLFFVVVIKELYLLGCLWMTRNQEELPGKYRRPSRREWFLDAVLVTHACLAWTVTWEAALQDTPMQREDPAMFILNLAIAALLFPMFYLPLRIPYYLEELARIRTGRDWLLFAASILTALVPALAALGD